MFSFLFASFIIMVMIIIVVILAKRVAVRPRTKRVYKFVAQAAPQRAQQLLSKAWSWSCFGQKFLSLSLSSRLPPGHFSPLFLFSSQGLDTEDVGQRLGAGLETSSLSCALPLMIHNITGALVSMHPFSCHTRVFPFSFTLYLFFFCFLFPLIAIRQFLSNLWH